MIKEYWIFTEQLVYVIGLHAVQFENNWTEKNSEDIILIISKLDKHVVLLPINYIASVTIQRRRLFPGRKTYV